MATVRWPLASLIALGAPLSAQHAFVVTSPTIARNATIPAAHTCDGANASPALNWFAAPAATRSFMIVLADNDGAAGTVIHWVAYDIPPTLSGIPERVATEATPPALGGGKQGKNYLGRVGFAGSCPPKNGRVHRYHYRVYALDTMLKLPAGLHWVDLQRAMTGHVLAVAQFMGKYYRTPQ